MHGKWNEMSEAKWERGRRRGDVALASVTLARNVATHRQRHTHILRHSLKLCSYPLFARTLRHFSTTFYGAAHPLSTLSSLLPLAYVQSKKHSTQTKALFPFSSGFSLPAFFLSFLGKLFMEFILLRCLPCPARPSLLPLFLPLSLPLVGPSVSVSFGSTVLIDNKKIIHFIQRCRRNAAMPSIWEVLNSLLTYFCLPLLPSSSFFLGTLFLLLYRLLCSCCCCLDWNSNCIPMRLTVLRF